MAEPAITALTARFHGKRWNRSRLRDKIGPDNPLFHLLEELCIRDLCTFVNDDFLGVLNTDTWTATSNGAGTADFVRVANTPTGKIRGDAGTDDNGDARLFMTSNEVVTSRRRPVLLGRLAENSAVASSKWEFGFADAVGAGAVLVKDTPTSTATDYAVIIRDTDDDTSVDLVTDGTTDAVGLVASSPGITFATATWYTLMLAGNENKEWYFWIDGVFQGVRRLGPDATTTLGVWLYIQNRDNVDNRQLDVDFVKGWQERTPLSGDAFTT